MSAGTRARGVVVLLLTTACPAALTNAAETIPASPVIPSMSTPPLRSPDGTPASLAAPGARLRLVNFWATWCAPCRKEMPELNRFADEYRNRGVVVIGVAADEIEDVRAFVSQLGIRYRILVGDADAVFGWSGGLGNVSGGLPYTVLLDAGGTVRWSQSGGGLTAQRLAPVVDRLLQAGTGPTARALQ